MANGRSPGCRPREPCRSASPTSWAPWRSMDRLLAGGERTRGAEAGVLLTDLYELTMLQAYFARRMNGSAVFELFIRKLPAQRNFLVAAGLDAVLDYLLDLRFTGEELEWMRASGRFTGDF